MAEKTNQIIIIEETPFKVDDNGFCGWKTVDPIPITVNVNMVQENVIEDDNIAISRSDSEVSEDNIISNVQSQTDITDTDENTADEDYLPDTQTKKLPKHSGITTKGGLKYYGGGRSKALEWEYVVRLPNNKARCKFCNHEVSGKVERIRRHLEKCSKFMENNNSEVIENENIEIETETTKSSQSTATMPGSKKMPLKLKSNFENQPPSKSKRQKTSNLDQFVTKTTKTQQSDIDLKVAEFFYTCNIPFATVENSGFLKMVNVLRPGYVPPNRKQLSGPLLDEVYNMYENKMATILFEQESNRPITLMLDGWSSCKNDPILASSIHTGNSSMLLSSKDCCSDKKTAEYHVQVAEENIKFCKDKFDRQIFAIVTDNENKMKSFRKQISEKYPAILTYGCSAHYLNILEKVVSPNTVLKHLIEIQTYMRNHHQPHGLLKEKNGLMPQIPNDTRWNSQIACVRTFNSNYLIYREIVKNYPDIFDDNITRKINDMNIYKNSLDLEVQLQLIGNALDKLQSDHVTLADAVLTWTELLNNKNLEPYKSDINKKFKEAMQPFHFVCFLTDPKFLEISLANAANEYEETAEKWLTENYCDYLQGYLLFRIKDTDLYPSSMFSESIIQAIPAHKWWLVIGAKFRSQNRQPFFIEMAKFFADLHSCPASSASLERIFSTFGFVWSDLRNRLAPEKVEKLVKILKLSQYENARDKDC